MKSLFFYINENNSNLEYNALSSLEDWCWCCKNETDVSLLIDDITDIINGYIYSLSRERETKKLSYNIEDLILNDIKELRKSINLGGYMRSNYSKTQANNIGTNANIFNNYKRNVDVWILNCYDENDAKYIIFKIFSTLLSCASKILNENHTCIKSLKTIINKVSK